MILTDASQDDDDSSDTDSDDDDASARAVLKRALKESQGGSHGSSSKFMADAFPSNKFTDGTVSQKFNLSDTTPDCVTQLRKHQWTNDWSLTNSLNLFFRGPSSCQSYSISNL